MDNKNILKALASGTITERREVVTTLLNQLPQHQQPISKEGLNMQLVLLREGQPGHVAIMRKLCPFEVSPGTVGKTVGELEQELAAIRKRRRRSAIYGKYLELYQTDPAQFMDELKQRYE